MSYTLSIMVFASMIDWTQVMVGVVAASGVIAAAVANNRGRKVEKKSDANNFLIDQLQESLIDYRDETRELRERIAVLDAKLVAVELHLHECHMERNELKAMVEELLGR